MPRANRQDDNPRTRICVSLDRSVLEKAREDAERQGRSLSNLVEWLLRTLGKRGNRDGAD